ncbi:unnamed protein product [Kuraishia capsulata CBS 1993]|uniref:Uncharacterized protein n=1 Tax=Kuraishia capsulata CBS 1993 TaxID=1382522 RepID=W6MFQ3_9ASCO|nr:uncharacterized protein KUCA_T00000675001 [Kuraishia capsulata CBS 1993]CDK24709.1 unnamed protein product [Kuraishia capsulata CBS 1993]
MVSADVENKKRRTEISNGVVKAAAAPVGSRIFSPFRVIGNVTNAVPLAIGTLGQTFYIVTCVGRSFQIFDANTLQLLFVSNKQTPSPITCLEARFHHVYCAHGNKIGIFKRGLLEHELECPVSEAGDILFMNAFGDFLVAATKTELFVFRKRLDDKYPTELYQTLTINPLDGEVVGIVHPPTYLNKIVVATSHGFLLLNIRTGKFLLKVTDFKESITCVQSAPALDIISLGTANGIVFLYNLKKGKIHRKIQIGIDTRINDITFRTDGISHLALSLSSGDIFFYDLERKSRIHLLRGAHKEVKGGVASTRFLNGLPILVTNGGDNSLKEYVFDAPMSTSDSSIVSPPRHLRSRGGHSAPPTSIQFADSKSHYILSASSDRTFWAFSLRKDAQSQQLSQKESKNSKAPAGGQKFPEITSIAQESAREREWENVMTTHKNETFARTWNSRNKRVGRWNLNTIDGGLATSVSITQCGNFGLVGSSTGGIGVYNLQSGILRKNYKLHTKTVTGLAVDGMNRKMVSCGLDGVIGFYDFSKSKFLGKLKLDAPITHMIYHKSSDLIAVALDNLSIVVIDVVTRKVVRAFYGHTNRITALDFSPNGRWIVSASLDATIMTWDLPTGSCIDGIRVARVVTDLKFSPTGDMLATTHVSETGISIWTNKAQFKTISTRQIDESAFTGVALPNVSGDAGVTMLEGAFDADEAETDADIHVLKDQIADNLVTLSLGPRSMLSTLINLQQIKARNKPKEAPKKPKDAPFFLQAGINGSSSSPTLDDGSEIASGSVLLNADRKASYESAFTKRLREAAENESYDKFLDYLVSCSPAIVDAEITSLNSFAPFTEIAWFVSALTEGLRSNKNYELIEAYMTLLINAHGDLIFHLKKQDVESDDQHLNDSDVEPDSTGDSELLTAIKKWEEANLAKNRNLEGLVKYCSGVLNFLNEI